MIRQERSGSVVMAVAWLLLVANWDSERLDFYRSNGDDLFAVGDTLSPVGTWELSANGFGRRFYR